MAASLELAAALDDWEMVEIEQVGLGLGLGLVRDTGPSANPNLNPISSPNPNQGLPPLRV